MFSHFARLLEGLCCCLCICGNIHLLQSLLTGFEGKYFLSAPLEILRLSQTSSVDVSASYFLFFLGNKSL